MDGLNQEAALAGCLNHSLLSWEKEQHGRYVASIGVRRKYEANDWCLPVVLLGLLRAAGPGEYLTHSDFIFVIRPTKDFKSLKEMIVEEVARARQLAVADLAVR